jgi:hypothetical protein
MRRQSRLAVIRSASFMRISPHLILELLMAPSIRDWASDFVLS